MHENALPRISPNHKYPFWLMHSLFYIEKNWWITHWTIFDESQFQCYDLVSWTYFNKPWFCVKLFFSLLVGNLDNVGVTQHAWNRKSIVRRVVTMDRVLASKLAAPGSIPNFPKNCFRRLSWRWRDLFTAVLKGWMDC